MTHYLEKLTEGLILSSKPSSLDFSFSPLAWMNSSIFQEVKKTVNYIYV